MIELLVAVAILAIMILSFSVVLSASQRVVSVSNSNMRKNTTATALSQILRTDLSRVTQNGFFYLGDSGDKDILIFTQAGLSESVTSAESGTGAVVTLGMANTGGLGSTLVRQGWVLDPGAPDDKNDDVWRYDLSQFLVLPLDNPGGGVDSVKEYVEMAIGDVPSSLTVPIEDGDDLRDLWQALAPGCTELNVQWTDGTRDSDGLKWYKANSGPSGYGETLDHGEYEGRVWTNDNQAVWPVAVKITVRVKDMALPPTEFAESDGNEYEVICTIGK
jgi:hypothetical protein